MSRFFFKQKTAYEMRISDWSSDVCSSDLGACGGGACGSGELQSVRATAAAASSIRFEKPHSLSYQDSTRTKVPSITWVCDRSKKIGRASCRERVCQYV